MLEHGVHLPYHVPTSREAMLTWFRDADAGPFARVCMGERTPYVCGDQMSVLAAAAASTERVRLQSGVTLLPAHPPALVAKRAATVDMLSGGRFELGVGVGTREDDFAAAGASFDHLYTRLDEGVAEMRRLWRQEAFAPGSHPVGPPPVQAGGPPVLCGVNGPRGLARAARWADGHLGWSLDGDGDELRDLAGRVRGAWSAAGRAEPPDIHVSVFFALGPDAGARLRERMGVYLSTQGSGDFSGLLHRLTVDAPDALRRVIEAAGTAGLRGLVWVPVSDDPRELHDLSEVIARG